MKKVLIAILLILFISGDANATEIAIINLEQILKNAKVMSYIEKELKNKKAEYQKEISKQEEVLANKNSELETKGSIMSKDALMEEIKQFQQDVLNFKAEAKKKEETLQNAYLEAVGEVNNEIRNIIKEMEKEEKYNFDIVIPENQTLYSNSSGDITAEVVTRLNKKMKTVKIDFNGYAL